MSSVAAVVVAVVAAAVADVVFNSSLSPFSCVLIYLCSSVCVCDCGVFFLSRVLFSSLDPFCCRFRQLVEMLLLHSNYMYTVYRMSKSNFLKHRSGGLNSGH